MKRVVLLGLLTTLACSDSVPPESGGAPGLDATDLTTGALASPGSGLDVTHLTVGTGASPGPSDRVWVHYHGTLEDGRVFDSTVERGTPARFPLNRVIACWTEGLQLMKVGGKARLVCPPEIAYGEQGRPPKIPGNSTLIFEVELIQVSAVGQ
jgi:FKBP-type peptidyl-prolyl cis-trans isomerase